MTPRQHASIAYAELGLQVFPLHEIRDGRRTCAKLDCGSPGKHPRTQHGVHGVHGVHGATDIVEQVDCWRAQPNGTSQRAGRDDTAQLRSWSHDHVRP